MSLWHRAVLYITRKKRRSIILILTIFVMSSFVLVGLALKGSADKEAKILRKSLGSSFNLELDANNMTRYEIQVINGISSGIYTGPMITREMVEKIAALDAVTDYVIDNQRSAWVNLELKPGLYAGNDSGYDEYPDNEHNNSFSREENRVFMHDTSILPTTNGELHENFRMGALEITEGRNIQEDDCYMAVISTELAERNNLKLGETFVIENKEGLMKPSKQPEKTLGKPIEVTIVGLFKPLFEQQTSFLTAESGIVTNLIYTDLKTNDQLNKNLDFSPEYEEGDLTFFVDDPKHLEETLKQVRALDFGGIDIRDFVLKADDSAYRASIKPLKLISTLAVVLLSVGIIGCVLILHLIIKIWTRERKQEIAIFLSFGEKRNRILLQIIVETTLLMAISLAATFLLSGFMTAGSAHLAEKLTKPMADEQAYTAEEEFAALAPKVEKVSTEAVHLQLTLTPLLIIEIVGVAILVTIISVLSASIRIVNMPPKKLLQIS